MQSAAPPKIMVYLLLDMELKMAKNTIWSKTHGVLIGVNMDMSKLASKKATLEFVESNRTHHIQILTEHK